MIKKAFGAKIYKKQSEGDFLNKNKVSAKTLVLGALMTALVIVVQLISTYTTFFGPFSTALALIPIVIGAALCGWAVGAWLGFVFGMVVLLSGGAALFLAFDIPGTIITVLAKGTLCGFAAGLVYKLLKRFNTYVAVVGAALVCPVVNTGVFLLGCALFFIDDAAKIAQAIGSNATGMSLFIALALGNFLFEVGANIVLSPVVVRLLNIRKSGR